jgi:hypothetical protein
MADCTDWLNAVLCLLAVTASVFSVFWAELLQATNPTDMNRDIIKMLRMTKVCAKVNQRGH